MAQSDLDRQFTEQRTQIASQARQQRESIEEQARKMREEKERQAREAQESLRRQRSGLEKQAQEAKGGIRTEERRERRKRELPATMIIPVEVKAKERIARVEKQEKEIKGKIKEAEKGVEEAKQKDIGAIEKVEAEAKAEVARQEAQVLTELAKAEAEFKAENIQLATGEYINRKEFDNLPSITQQKLNELGVEGYNNWLGEQQAALSEYKAEDGYDLAGYLRDNPQANTSNLVAIGFEQPDIDSAVEANKEIAQFESDLKASSPELFQIYNVAKEKGGVDSGIEAYNLAVVNLQSVADKYAITAPTPEEYGAQELARWTGKPLPPIPVKFDLPQALDDEVPTSTLFQLGITQTQIDNVIEAKKIMAQLDAPTYKSDDGYDLPKFLRDNPSFDTDKLVTVVGFSQKAVDSAVEYNQQDWVKPNPVDAYHEALLKTDFFEKNIGQTGWGKVQEGQKWFEQHPEIVKLLEAANAWQPEQREPTLSKAAFFDAYLAARGIDKDSPEALTGTWGVAVDIVYSKLYGFGTSVASELTGMTSYLFSPVRVLYPEVELKDISALEWAVGGAQLALFAIPVVGLSSSVAAKAIITGVEVAAGATFAAATGIQWADMSWTERGISLAMTAAILAPTGIRGFKWARGRVAEEVVYFKLRNAETNLGKAWRILDRVELKYGRGSTEAIKVEVKVAKAQSVLKKAVGETTLSASSRVDLALRRLQSAVDSGNRADIIKARSSLTSTVNNIVKTAVKKPKIITELKIVVKTDAVNLAAKRLESALKSGDSTKIAKAQRVLADAETALKSAVNKVAQTTAKEIRTAIVLARDMKAKVAVMNRAIRRLRAALKSGNSAKIARASSVVQRVIERAKVASQRFTNFFTRLESLTAKQLRVLEKKSGIVGLRRAVMDVGKAQARLDKLWQAVDKVKARYGESSPQYIKAMDNVAKAQANLESAFDSFATKLEVRTGISPAAGYEDIIRNYKGDIDNLQAIMKDLERLEKSDISIMEAREINKQWLHLEEGDISISSFRSKVDDLLGRVKQTVGRGEGADTLHRAWVKVKDRVVLGEDTVKYLGAARDAGMPPPSVSRYMMRWTEGEAKTLFNEIDDFLRGIKPTEGGGEVGLSGATLERYGKRRPLSPEAQERLRQRQTEERVAYEQEMKKARVATKAKPEPSVQQLTLSPEFEKVKPQPKPKPKVPKVEVATKPKAKPTPSEGVPTMITKKMEAQLRDLGYTDAQINKMTPKEAWGILNKVTPEKAKSLSKKSAFPGVSVKPKVSIGGAKVSPIPQEAYGRMTGAQIAREYGVEIENDPVTSTQIGEEIKTNINTVLKPFTKSSPNTIREVQTILANAIKEALRLRTQGLTEAQINAKVQSYVKNLVRQATEAQTQAKTQTKALTKTQTKTLTKTVTKVATRVALRVRPRPRIPRIPIIVTLPDGSKHTLTPEEIMGSVGWKQGFIFRAIWPPYGKNNVTHSRKPILGIPYYKGAESAYRSIIRRGGKLPPTIARDMGIFDVYIESGRYGKPRLIFKQDVKQKTRVTGKHRKTKVERQKPEPSLSSMR